MKISLNEICIGKDMSMNREFVNLRALADDIKENGMDRPILVTPFIDSPDGGKYIIVAGNSSLP